jgi:hypothetical protein
MLNRQRILETQIRALKRDLTTLAELRPGSLSRQSTVCGSVGCRCKAVPPQKHGPYYHLSYTRHGKGGTRLVRKEDLAATRRAIKTYARRRRLVDRWIALATELADLKLPSRAASSSPVKRR